MRTISSTLILLALSAPALGQTSKPTKPAKQPASQPTSRPAAPKGLGTGKIIYTRFVKRQATVQLFDLETGKGKTLLADGSLCNGVSPNGTLFVTWNKRKNELSFRSIADPKVVLGSLPQTFGWPSFLDEDTVVLPDYSPKGDPAIKFQINRIKIKSGERTSLAGFPDTSWDDVPIALSPDRKKLVFFLRGAARGLHILDIPSGRTGPLVPGGTVLRWASNTHCLVYERKGSQTWWCKLNTDGLSLTKVESLGGRAFPGGMVGGRVIYARPSKANPRGLEIVARDPKTKAELTVSADVTPGELTMLSLITPLPGGAFVFVEGKPPINKLVWAKFEQGKLKKHVLAIENDAMIGLPLSVP